MNTLFNASAGKYGLATCLAACLIVGSFSACGTSFSAQPDYFLRPFSASSPWNTPIGHNAQYTPIPDLATYPAALNQFSNGLGIWTTGIWDGRKTTTPSTLYIFPGNLWALLNHNTKLTGGQLPDGGENVNTVGNSPAVEQVLRASSKPTNMPGKPCNFYSTTSPTTYVPPTDVVDLTSHWTNTIYVPLGAAPSRDGDAQLAVLQPSGFMLECYNAIVCSNGDVVCSFASFTDPKGDGTGYENGRCASLIPNYAGKIRSGEITSGVISHALCVLMPARLLSAQMPMYQPPAHAFDMSNGYKGTIPMGSLLAIPAGVDLGSLGLSSKGITTARAAQIYGVYATDRGGGGLTIMAEAGASDAYYPGADNDISIIVHNLKVVSNAGK